MEEYRDKIDDEGKRLLTIVRDNVSRMGHSIDNILAFSRAGRKDLTQPAGMAELAKTALEDLKPSMQGRDVKAGLGALPSTLGDAAMPHQVLTNLIENAVKFTKNKDHAAIDIGGRIGDGENIYCVKDNGAGFEMRFSDRLFGVFQRLHGDGGEFEGAGIGLAIIKRIDSRHRGRVWAESKLNEGAAFYFALPESKEEERHA